MRLLFYSDPHWSQNSSIIRSRGQKYSKRLENLIQSINWAEELAYSHGCSWIVCGGDFFDTNTLNSEELSALKEIHWAPLIHIFLTGNHETSVSSLDFSANDVFNLCPNSVVINKPECNVASGTETEFAFLPYILERDRLTIEEYFGPKTRKRILFSHNDIKDVQYGAFLSTEGFTIDDIHKNSDLCLNGHIHHCAYVAEGILNGGNLTGQNFTEDASKFEHCAMIVDTETLCVDFYRNPYAFNFYKLDFTHVTSSEECHSILDNLMPNAVLTVKCNRSMLDCVRNMLESSNIVTEYRLLVEDELCVATDSVSSLTSEVDHLKQFEEYVLSEIGDTNIIREELSHIMR